MGCWNKTCGLSRLHIRAGERTYVFALEQNPSESDRCYSTAFWSPVMLPFQSTYNDYGGGEDSDQYLQYIINGLKESMVEMELGKNECHDIAVKKDAMGEELFFESIHENRLYVADRAFGGQRMVEFVMLKKSIVDHILDNLVLESYVGDGKGTCGYENNYIQYSWATLVEDSEEFIEAANRMLTGEPDDDDLKDLPARLRLKYGIRNLDSLFDWKHPNKAASYLRGIDDYKFSRIVRPMEIFTDLLTAGKRDEAKALLIEVLRASFINSFMERSRINWGPAGHEGSQSQDHEPYRALIAAMTAELDAEVAEQAEWDAEYEDEE